MASVVAVSPPDVRVAPAHRITTPRLFQAPSPRSLAASASLRGCQPREFRIAGKGRFSPASRRREGAARCAASSSGGGEELSLAPGKTKTPFGDMLRYYLEMEPQLFQAAVDEQLTKLQEARDKEAKDRQSSSTPALDLVLYRRMNEVKARETRDMVEDLMYLSVLEKFVTLEVSMLPRLDGVVDVPGTNLKALTEGIHSKEALAMVKDHLMAMMGPAANAFSNTAVKMSKLQMTQVYAASIMFGYFLRRVDKRFQLEKAFGSLSGSLSDEDLSTDEETVYRLERLFNSADASGSDPDVSTPGRPGESGFASLQRQPNLKEYVESFDQATLMETAQVLSLEAAALVERQTTALFGDVKELQQQMSQAIGEDSTSMEDLMQRISEAVTKEKVSTLTMSVGTQRRAVLEAVAFGTFLRDVETRVDEEFALLTAAPSPLGPGGMLEG